VGDKFLYGMSKIIVVPPKTIKAPDKAKMEKKGFIVIEVDDPTKVVILGETSVIQSNDLAFIAISTLCEAGTDTIQASFTRRLYNNIKQQRAATTEQQPKTS
jgi:hypothetical protein